jgi:hypothetical protein
MSTQQHNVVVTIPDNLKEGDQFMFGFQGVAGDRQVVATVPPGYRGGQKLQLLVQGESEEEINAMRKKLAGAGPGCVRGVVLFLASRLQELASVCANEATYGRVIVCLCPCTHVSEQEA